ncbi:MAG: hypothetical protein KDC52_11305, partial [Ignavibacteriae bacterium]|nr:hypothetical protein [Ignavibacteriota bacterium]
MTDENLMQDINKILTSLSPEKRAILEKKLKNESSKYNSFPLSFAQKRLWFLAQFDPDSIEFNIPTAIELKGNLNFDALQYALNEIEKRHEILRTQISTVDDQPIQVIKSASGIVIDKLKICDTSSENEIETNFKEIIKNKCRQRFSLSKDKLFDITLIDISENRTILLLVMHHIITDGWSVGVFIKELSLLYDSYLGGNHKYTLPELSIQYADYAKWQAEWINSKKFKNKLQFWIEYLADAKHTLELPVDFNLDKPKTNEAGSLTSIIPKNKAVNIREYCASEHITNFMFFAAIINVFLSKYSSQKDIIIGIPVANRQKKETQNLIGFFVNVVLLRSKISYDISFNDFIVDVRKNILDVLEHEDIPFELLVEELQPERNLNSTPLFRVMYSYATNVNAKLELAGIDLAKVDIDFKVAQYDLTF